MQKGDKFICYTKYGGIVKGEIDLIGERVILDITNKISYIESFIITTNGIPYDSKDIKIISREYTQEEIERMERVMERLAERKNEWKDKISRQINPNLN